MNKCQFCGENTDNINHRLANIDFNINITESGTAEITDWNETWECTVSGKRFEGKLSEKASEEAKKDYRIRGKLWASDFMIKVNPENSKAYKEKGECYFELKQYKPAIDDFGQAINYNQKDADSYYLRGKSYECIGKPDLAIRDFMNAARLDHKKAKDELTKKGIKW